MESLSVLFLYLRSSILNDYCALLDNANPISQSFGLVEVVRGEDDGAAGASQR